jgi:hypothetical protein
MNPKRSEYFDKASASLKSLWMIKSAERGSVSIIRRSKFNPTLKSFKVLIFLSALTRRVRLFLLFVYQLLLARLDLFITKPIDQIVPPNLVA